LEDRRCAREANVTRTLFISYSHEDNKEHRWVERLTPFLDGLRDQLPIDPWVDNKLKSGENWRDGIADAISRAAAAVLLVGPNFLASQFIKENELPDLLQAKKAGTLSLFPLVVAYSPWELSVLEKHQAFNDPKFPLESMKPAEQNMWLNKLVLAIADEMRSENVVSAKTVLPLGDLRAAVAVIMSSLSATNTAFRTQSRRRDALRETMVKRLNITERLEHERFFFRYYGLMDEEERFEFDQIRALTDGPLHDNNRSILDTIEANPGLLDELPILAALRLHLIIWLNKYDRVFTKSEKMSVLYVGVEDGVPFPRGVDQSVAEWLAEH
jgi:hypothetical protein